MNQLRKNFLLLAILSASSALVQARISNIVYNKATDATATVDGNNNANVAGRPMFDPTLSDNFTSLDPAGAKSQFGLSYLNSADNTLVLVETGATNKGARTLMKARVEGGAVKLESLVKPPQTVTQVANNGVGVDAGEQLATLQNLQFSKGASNGQKTVLKNNANTTSGLLIVDNTSGDFIQTAVTDGNPVPELGNPDDFIVIGDRIVTGVLQNGTTEYLNNAHGRIRVLNLAGEQIGVAKNRTGQEIEIRTTNAPSPLKGSLHNLTTNNDSLVSRIGSMHWDARLQRLFLAFSRDDIAILDQTRMPFLVGRFDGNDLKVEPLAGDAMGVFAADSANSSIISHKINSNDYSVPYLKTLHVTGQDSTGASFDRPYLIAQINYDHATPNRCGKIFAVPLVNPTLANEYNLGKAADVTSVATLKNGLPADAIGKLYSQDPTSAQSDVRALVGGNRVPVDAHTDILNMQVVGQTVLVSAGFGATSGQTQIGIWASTAIIQEDGFIVGWTPWNRVAGMFEQVYRMHYNENTGQLWTVHSDTKTGAPTHIAGVTIPTFGTGLMAPKFANGNFPVAATGWDAHGFGSIRTAMLQSLSGSVYSTRHFQARRTPGLSGRSLYAAGGDGKVFLALANAAAAGAGEFYKNSAYSNHAFENTPNTSTTLEVPAAGRVYATEVSRSREDSNEGWLFVGGENGLFVVTAGANDGDGTWNTKGDSIANFTEATLAAIAGGSIKKISQVAGPIIGLAAVNTQTNGNATITSNEYLLILTKTGLYRITPSAANFATQVTADAIVPEAIDLGLAADEYCLTLEMLSHHLNTNNIWATPCGAVVTTKGLYMLKELDNLLLQDVKVKKQPVMFGGQDISSKIRRVQMLPRAPFANAGELRNITGTFSNQIANLLVVTGTLADPASEIFLVPLTGGQAINFNKTNGCQGTYDLDENAALSAVRIASADSLGGRTLAAASMLGLPVTASSVQYVDGQVVAASVDQLGGGQIEGLEDASISSMTANSGGSGSLVITERNGQIIVQE